MEKQNQQKMVDNWNTKHPVGTKVSYLKDNKESIVTYTKKEAFLLSGHTACVMLEGVSHVVALEKVSPVTDDAESIDDSDDGSEPENKDDSINLVVEKINRVGEEYTITITNSDGIVYQAGKYIGDGLRGRRIKIDTKAVDESGKQCPYWGLNPDGGLFVNYGTNETDVFETTLENLVDIYIKAWLKVENRSQAFNIVDLLNKLATKINEGLSE